MQDERLEIVWCSEEEAWKSGWCWIDRIVSGLSKVRGTHPSLSKVGSPGARVT